jgi:hypothetical protein
MVINGVRGAAMAMGQAVTSVGKQASLADLNRTAMVALQVAASLPKQSVSAQAMQPAAVSAPMPTATRSAVIVARANPCPEPPYGFQGPADGAHFYYGPDGRTIDRAATQAYFACLNAQTPQAPAPAYPPEAPPAAGAPYEYPAGPVPYSYPSSSAADGYVYPTAAGPGAGPGGPSAPSADMAPPSAAKPAGTVQAANQGAPAAGGTSTATYVGIGAGVVALGALLYFATR